MFPSKSTEFQFIDRIRQQSGDFPGVVLGIGDDAAALTLDSGVAVVTADMLLEGVHFECPPATAHQIGRKSINVNLSDLAAMAATPRFAVVTLCLPYSEAGAAGTRDASFADELMTGMIEAAREFDVAVVGGDTTAWNGPLVISVTAIGEAHPKGLVTRSGARVGDWICVTGELGGSLFGRHLDFVPRVREALFLRESVLLSAMLDISDGLVADLYHILEESGCGAELQADAIPVSQAACSDGGNRSPLQRALGDGEDFELLFTLPRDAARELLQRNDLPVRVSAIGEIVAETGCRLRENGQWTDLPRLGWSHAVHESNE